jgi:hypothetical protein
VICIILFITPAIAEEKIIDKEFVMVNSYLVLMTVFDIESTFSAIHNGAHEANPVMKPFVKSGRLATYGINLAVDALIIWASYEIKGSKNKDLKKTWWLLPMITGTAHGVCGGLNMRYVW